MSGFPVRRMRGHRAGWLAVGLVVLAGCSVAPHTAEEAAARPRVHETLTSAEELKGLCVVVPVQHAGRTWAFVLDTGTSGVIFDEVFREELGKARTTRRLHTPRGVGRTQLFDPPEAFMGSVDLAQGGLVGCGDLESFRSLYGCDVRGIVGMSVLRNYVVRIDFTRAAVDIMSADGEPHPEWGMAVPMAFDRMGIPQVTASVGEGVKVRMDIDTGDNSCGDLGPEVFARVGRADTETRVTTSVGFGGVRAGKSTRVTGLRLGHYTYRDLPFTDGPWSRLGVAFLARHHVTFDFPNRKMYLVKLMEPVRPARTYVSGLLFKRVTGALVVGQVLAGSPAGEAGVHAGDILLRIAHADAAALESWQAARLLMSDREQEVTLTVERDGKPLDFTFKLRRGL